MRTLVDHRGAVCTRSELLTEVWGDERTDANALEACIRRIRLKLGQAVIETIRSTGYRLVDA